MTDRQQKLRAIALSVLMVMSVVAGVAALGGTAGAAANTVSAGNGAVSPAEADDNQSFQSSIDYNITGVNTSDGTTNGEIALEFDSEFDLSSASVSTVSVESTGTDSNTTNVDTNLNSSANNVSIFFTDSGGSGDDTLRVQITIDGLQVSNGDGNAEILTSIDADATNGFEITSESVGTITLDQQGPTIATSTSNAEDTNAMVNVSVTDNRAVDESTIDVSVTNTVTGATYALVESGNVTMGSPVGAYNASDGSDNATEFVNVSAPLQEGSYTIDASATDINDNDGSVSDVGGFSVDMAGDSLKVVSDSSNPLAGDNAAVDVVAVDQNGNELLFDDGNVNAAVSDIQLSFDDPDNATVNRPSGTPALVNDSGSGYEVTFDVAYSQVGDLQITASDFGGNLAQGSATQTYTAELSDVEVTAEDGTLVADGSDTESVTLQLVDQNGNDVPRSGVGVTWGIISGNKNDAGVMVNATDAATDSDGTATIVYNATESGYEVEVAGQADNYADTAAFNTTAGGVSAANSVFTLNGQTGDVDANDANPVQVNTTHELSAEILDAQDNALADYPVTFTANGTEIASLTTDSDGVATTNVTLPTDVGTTQLNVSAGSFNASATSDAQINVTSIPADASTLVYTSDARVAPANSSADVTVEVRDEFGNVNTTAVEVTLTSDDASVIDVEGSASATKTTTDGNVTFTANANATAGSTTLTANASGLSSTSDTFSINSPSAIDLSFTPVSSLTTSDEAGAYDATLIEAQLVDSSGDALAIDNADVSFGKVSGNSAVLNSTSATTNSDGVASVYVNATETTGTSDFIAQSPEYDVQGRTSIETVGAVDSLTVAANQTEAPAGDAVSLTATFRDSNDNVVPVEDTVTLDTNLGTVDDSVDLTPDEGVVRGEAILTAGQGGTANITAIAQNAGLADETSVEFVSEFGLSDVSLEPSTVEGNQTVEHDLAFTVTDASSDGNTDTYTLTLPASTSFVNAGNATVNVTDANGSAVSIEGGPSVQDANSGTDNQITFDIAPDNSFDTSALDVSATFQVAFPDVENETTADVTIDVEDSARGDVSAGTPVTIEPSTANVAAFEVSDLSPTDVTVTQGDVIDVSATVANTGGVAGTQDVQFRVGGNSLANESVSLNASENTTVEFTGIDTGALDVGNYTHGVYTDDDNQTATLTVEAEQVGNISLSNVALDPATVNASTTNDHTLTFDVANVSDDGNTDTFTVTFPENALESANDVTVTDADGDTVDVTGLDTSGNVVTASVSPDSNADVRELTVEANVTVSAPDVNETTAADITIMAVDSNNGEDSAVATLTVEPVDEGQHESGVSQELFDAVAGDDGELSRTDTIDTVQSYINDEPVDGITLTRSDVIQLVQFYINQ